MINDEIREKEVRVIGADGKQLGIMDIDSAQKLADDANLDLVNISPKAVPPVCRIMDYGKYRFEQEKKIKEAKKNQKVVEVKEMRLSATIDSHDLETKAKNVQKFLDSGNKVKVSIKFRGRQLAHTNTGLDVMMEFAKLLENVSIEKPANMEGRSMFMILAPKNS